MLNITWTQFLSGLFAVIIAIAGGSFTICKYAKDGEISEYRLKIESLEERIDLVEKQLVMCLKASERQVISENNAFNRENIDSTFVKIIKPLSGTIVDPVTNIEFSINGTLPRNVHPLLVIRDPYGQWWSWGTSKTNLFENIKIGEKHDSKESFEIRVILTDEEFRTNEPHFDLPRFIASDSIIVIRK